MLFTILMFWKIFGNVCVALGQFLENLQKSQDGGLKIIKNVAISMFI